MLTDTDSQADVRTDGDDSEIFSHYAEKDAIVEAVVLGIPIVALCGKIWIPSRDPDKYPICPKCKMLHDALFLKD